MLGTRGLMIVNSEADGNFLFRSVSHQIYNTTKHHEMIRSTVVQYLRLEWQYFVSYVIDGDIFEHIECMSQNGCWGDDLEIQAMSEIYKCPVTIFSYSYEPMKTFHESVGSSTPMRLSYHNRSHYNSIAEKDRPY